MKKIVAETLVDEMQKENIRLKEEIIKIRKELINFERIMMELLIKIDESKVIHETPLQCLLAFCQELQANLCDFSNKQTEISTLRKSLQETKRKFYETNSQLSDLLLRYENRESDHKKAISNYSKFQKQLELQILSLKRENQTLKQDLDGHIKSSEIRQIQFDQEKRVAVAAVVHATRDEMLEYRTEVEKEFNKETVKLKDDLKTRDEMFKALAKNIQNMQQDKSSKSENIQWDKLNQVVQSIVKFEEMNLVINNLSDENIGLRKQVKDANNRKYGLQIRLNEFRGEITSYQNKINLKNAQIDQLNLHLSKIKEQLTIEKKGNKNLQKYYQQKWHTEFENVKRHLEKNYQEKILDNQRELEMKKSEVTRKINMYLFMHDQDQKRIKQLEQQILKQQAQKKQVWNRIEEQKAKIYALQKTLSEFNLMAREQELSAQYQRYVVSKKNQAKIQELSDKIILLMRQCNSAESKINDSMLDMEKKFEKEKQELNLLYLSKLGQVEKQQQAKYKQIEEQKKKLIIVYLKQNEEIKESSQHELKSLQSKYINQLFLKNKELEQEKTIYKQFVVKAFSNQKTYRKEIKDLRDQFEEKIKEYEAQIEQKKALLRFQNQKNYKDTNLKKQMRELIQKKVAEMKDLMKEKDQLRNQLEAKESEINHLTHELDEYKFTRDNWIELTDQIRTEFFEDYSRLKENYSNQISVFKSKIWQLENIILKRPIRAQDEVKIRNLSEQKKNLEQKIQIKEAENGVLKQIKHYYERKNQTMRYNADMRQNSEVNLGTVQHRKGPSILIMTKRVNKRRQNHERVKSQLNEEGQGNDDIRLMKRYLIKNIQKEQLKMLKQQERSRNKTFYNHKVSFVSEKE